MALSMQRQRSNGIAALLLTLLVPRTDRVWWLFTLLALVSLVGREIAATSVAKGDFEGFEDAEFDEDEFENDISRSHPIPTPAVVQHLTTETDPPEITVDSPSESESSKKPLKSSEFYWDEDEFEGVPPPEDLDLSSSKKDETKAEDQSKKKVLEPRGPQSYYVEVFSIGFLIAFAINFFVGKRRNERIALAWTAQFATKNGIFEKNFSLLGTGDGKDTPLLLKEGQNVFKFYASGRRFCQWLLATMELKSRHDLVSTLYNCLVPSKDEMTIEVVMNDDSMDHIIFALARKKVAKTMQKELKDLSQYATMVSAPTSHRKWLADDLVAISESREVALDLITETVLDQVFGEKAFEKYGQGFISLHFTDVTTSDSHKKMLIFKFALPSENNMSDMTRLIAIVPYYIDLIGRYKLSPQIRAKTENVRAKIAKELHKEQQLARQEAIQRKKEESESKFSAEAIRKKEEKARQRQLKKSMPRMKMTRVH
eukprot:TRINITY_DN2025_c0_g1_i1.p1 TRINITY_DN2025_c0_g1~~TRINITY_DN2025_c0_g1_i1.p1  ORF type:complete len:484 (-),score=96.16 TRINITY_DN2025_c0_g1_i1:187-1638(-)